MRIVLFFVIVCFIAGDCIGQTQVRITCYDHVCTNIDSMNTAITFDNLYEAEFFMKKLLQKVHQKGFHAACYDSLQVSDSLIFGVLNPGPQLILAGIRFRNIEPEMFKNAEIKKKKHTNTIFSSEDIYILMKEMVEQYENSGYPFARVFLDSLEFRNDTLTATLAAEKGKMFMIDTIINNGNLDVNPQVLWGLCGIFPGNIYNEKEIRELSEKLRIHRFVREKAPPAVRFTENGAVIQLYLDKRPVNTFDGMIGFMPDYRNEGKLFLTGELMLSVSNAMSLAERIRIKWRQPEKLSQDMKAGISLPWLIYLPLGLSWDFGLLKKDTTFLTIENKIALLYSAGINGKTGAYVNFFRSSLISVQQYAQAIRLPPFNDMNVSSVGMFFSHHKTNHLLNPGRGVEGVVDISAGKKNIMKNSGLSDALYDDIELNTIRFRGESDISVFIPLMRTTTLHLRNYSGILRSPQLFINELFQLGGLHNIRGFDENRFYASAFSIQTFEFRYLFEENSRFVIFADVGYLERRLHDSFLIERPLGLGAGMTLDTQQGVFSLFYGLGKTQTEPLSFRSSKVHFGYIVMF
jgi:outer membrane protein assembly factor BamA